MARPQKNSCDYFSHDNDMRNHRKVKSIRNKFGIQGYAIWSMLLEYLTGIDGNEFEYSDFEFELISGDFGVSVTEIREVVDYCVKLEMLFNDNGFIYSESLNERLAPVYKKRGVAKDRSEKQKRINGKFSNNNDTNGVSVTEMPQSKVNESKEDKNKVNESKKTEEISKEILPSVPVVSEIKKVINSPHGDGELHYLCRVHASENEKKYPADMYKEFLQYWTAIVTNGKLKKHNGKEKWRNEETFVIELRLSTWFKNYNKDAKNNNTNFGASKGLGATAVFSADKDYS